MAKWLCMLKLRFVVLFVDQYMCGVCARARVCVCVCSGPYEAFNTVKQVI